MAIVHLRHPLRGLVGDREQVEADGDDIRSVLDDLERRFPDIAGWVLDDRGQIRRHVNVFVRGERAGLEEKVAEGDEIHILHAISGGSGEAELLVGTRKGLFVLRGERGGQMEIAERQFAGSDVEFAMRDPRSGTYIASVTNGFYGPRLYVTDDPAAEWDQAQGLAFPEDAETTVERAWVVKRGEADGELWAGVAPAALFKSTDGGRTWTLNRGLWDEPSRKDWGAGAGGQALHSICTWPGDPSKIAVGISAAGVWISEDGGGSWRRGGKGLVPEYLPEDSREGALELCVHNMHRAPERPERMFMQFHGGVYRSDDAGENWADISKDNGLPNDFGFPLVVDPADPDAAYVIPLDGAMDRVTPGGKVRVYETRDAGASWTERGEGLPQEDAYLTILRQAFCHDGQSPLGLYFGATSGTVFGSADAGASWTTVARDLPPVLSVRCSS